MSRILILAALVLFAALAAGGGALRRDAVATSPYAFIPDSENDVVRVLDSSLNSMAIIPVGDEPIGIDFSPDGSRAYVANRVDGTLSVIDTGTLTLVGTYPIASGAYLLGVDVSPDGGSVYIAANTFGPPTGGIWRFETASHAVTQVVANEGSWQATVTPDGDTLIVVHTFGPTGHRLDFYDTATYTLQGSSPEIPGAELVDIALNRNGTLAFVPHGSPSPGEYPVYVIDVQTHAIVATVPAGRGPFRVAVNACGDRAYVTNYEGNQLQAIDLVTPGYPVTALGPVAPEDPAYTVGLSIDPADGSILLSRDAPNGVIRIDAGTGLPVEDAYFSGGSTGQAAVGRFFAPAALPTDTDGDGFGDPCDADDDNDGTPDVDDACPTLPGPAARRGCPDACSVAPTIVGTPGNDHIVGTTGNDVIWALGGNDHINGNGGDDLICAGDGNDHVVTGDGDDVVDTGAGNDHVTSGAGDDIVDTGDGNDKIVAGFGDDLLFGGTGNDKVDGGAGSDTCDAGSGNNQVTNCEA